MLEPIEKAKIKLYRKLKKDDENVFTWRRDFKQ